MSSEIAETTKVRRPWQAILLNRKMLICLFQGFSSGLPLYILIQMLPAWLRTSGVDLATIGLFSLIALPYTWKFVWSPLLDRYRLPFLGRRRGWTVASQVLLFVCIAQFATYDPSANLSAVAAIVFMLALFSATQDIVLDAYRREMLADDELGIGNSLFINAYRFSSLVPGSLAFILADAMSWTTSFWIVASFMFVGIIVTMLVPETADDAVAPKSLREAVMEPFIEFFTRNSIKSGLLVLGFLLLYKLGDNLAVALQTPFFIDAGFSLTQIGTVAKFTNLGASAVGAAIGGVLMLKLSINRALWIFGFVQMASILGFAALAAVGNNVYVLFVAMGMEYIGVGLGTVALTAFIAKQASIHFTATQLALLSSVVSIPRTFANAATGFIIEAIGYFNFFLLCTTLAVPGMLMLLYYIAPWHEPD